MPVGLPSTVEIAGDDLDREAVLLFSLCGLTLSLYLLHLLPIATVDAMMLLTCAG
jgi:hypothetical protein